MFAKLDKAIEELKFKAKLYWYCLLSSLLSDKAKRILVMGGVLVIAQRSSLGKKDKNKFTISKETLERANSVLNLCSNAEALRLPMDLYSIRWGDKEYQIDNYDISTYDGLYQFAKEVEKDIPVYLRYSKEQMVTDIGVCISQYFPEHRTAA